MATSARRPQDPINFEREDANLGANRSIQDQGNFPRSDRLGLEFSQFLRQRLDTPVSETEEFRLGAKAIGEGASGIAKRARQRLGDAGVSGGFLDSGNLQLSGNLDIDRAELASFTGAIRELLLNLEDRRTEGILPFLSGAQGAFDARADRGVAKRGQNLQFAGSALQSFTTPF